jgi:hypothetical protein
VRRNSLQVAAKHPNLPKKAMQKHKAEMLRSALTFIESNTIIRSHNEQMIVETRIWPSVHSLFDDNETQHSARHCMRRIQFKGRTT